MKRLLKALDQMTAKTILLLIKCYQLTLSPWIGNSCRFHPTCSRYCSEAISNHGSIRGIYLSCRRLLRCHPGCQGGYDPVPDHWKQPTSGG